MHVTSAADAALSERRHGAAVRARLNRPAATAAVALAGWLAFVIARWQTWAGGHITLFIMSGVKFSHPAQMSPRISHVPSAGYDGQFFYRLALNPFNWHPTAYGITMDNNYRYTRIGYPLVTWLLSAGQHRLVPTVLVVVNLACVAAMAWFGAVFALEAGRHALWGLLFAAYFGLAISVGRDTAEPLADACMLGGMLAYRHSRYILATAAITYAVITNEPALALPVALALTRLYAMYARRAVLPGGDPPPLGPPDPAPVLSVTSRGRKGLRPLADRIRAGARSPRSLRRAKPGVADLAWVVPGTAFVVFQGLEKILVKGKAGGAADITRNLTLPFRALVPGVYRDIVKMSWTHLGMYDFNLIEFIALALFVVAGFLVLRSTTAPVHERVAFAVFVVVEMVIASGQFWDSVFNDGRTYIDCYLMAVILLIATPAVAPAGSGEPPGSGWRRFLPAGRTVTIRELGWLAEVVIAVLILVARRRILFE